MEFQYDSDRVYAKDEQGRLLAEVTFGCADDGTCIIDHTYVHPSLRNQGVADQLLREACKQMRKQNKKAIPTCSYAVGWFRKNPDEGDVLK
ncbi:MAG: GNAT family N-acetyltransferase [Anaerofustis sp.]